MAFLLCIQRKECVANKLVSLVATVAKQTNAKCLRVCLTVAYLYYGVISGYSILQPLAANSVVVENHLVFGTSCCLYLWMMQVAFNPFTTDPVKALQFPILV